MCSLKVLHVNTPLLERVWAPKFLEKESNSKKLMYHVAVASTIPFAFLGDMFISLVAKPLGYEVFSPRIPKSTLKKSVNWINKHKIGVVVTTTVVSINTIALTYSLKCLATVLTNQEMKIISQISKEMEQCCFWFNAHLNSQKYTQTLLEKLNEEPVNIHKLLSDMHEIGKPLNIINKITSCMENLFHEYLLANGQLSAARYLKNAYNGEVAINFYNSIAKTVEQMKSYFSKKTIGNLLSVIGNPDHFNAKITAREVITRLMTMQKALLHPSLS